MTSFNRPSHDKLLFTPGPLTTSRTVKQAMLRDLGSRDFEFIDLVHDIRQRLVQIAYAPDDQYTAVIMQGSGTFAVEAVIGSVIPPTGKLLVIVNGAYGQRMTQIAAALQIDFVALNFGEEYWPELDQIEQALARDPAITHVSVVHCETTTGLLNPIEAIGSIVHRHGRQYIVDAMSSFGAVPIDLTLTPIDYLISSANKCLEGVPGCAFVIAQRDALLATADYARSLSLNLFAQWQGLEQNGQFRFTPPTHVLLALAQALEELEAEGGVAGRAARYKINHESLMWGMRRLGFQPLLKADRQSDIITSFLYPRHPNFNFADFYERLNAKGCVIYPGKLGTIDCFRIGNIGRLFETDILNLLCAIEKTLHEMNIDLHYAIDHGEFDEAEWPFATLNLDLAEDLE
jgi:2-aminoethylphosphonate-pyruvate transaminase